MRKRWVIGAALAAAVAALAVVGLATAGSSSHKATKVTVQLKWVTQAQFAGFYAAQANGYYKQAGLDVNLKLGDPDIVPEQVVLGGQAEFGVDWLPQPVRYPRWGQGHRQHRSGLRPQRHDRGDV